jgi:UDPglucose 6-dehydrogenase
MAAQRPDLSFACSPENLRLGKAIEVFKNPDRVVIGVRGGQERQVLERLISPLTDRIEWMSVESAEMTKHALNTFLALSVTFANEIAALCEKVAADAKDVERGLKSERRIGPGAYLSPGPAFAGGTLARDVAFLNDIAVDKGLTTPLLAAIKPSNAHQASWPERKLREALGDVKGKKVGIWGLTYKPGTDTLRRSSSVELCRLLAERGAQVFAYDPAIQSLPSELGHITLSKAPEDVADGAAALVVMTPWPDFREVDMRLVIDRMAVPNVLDPGRVLSKSQIDISRVRYFSVGTAQQGGARE